MQNFARILTLTVLAVFASSAAHDIGGNCSDVCKPITNCTLQCFDSGGNDSTCGDFGVCQMDADSDGVLWNVDNCPNTYNPNQADCDGDTYGDACDALNGIYQQAYQWNTCYVVDHAHFFYMDETNWQEATFRDVSACHGPDQVRSTSLWGYCAGYFPPSYADSCCLSLWGRICLPPLSTFSNDFS
jgi:hypothetical protein